MYLVTGATGFIGSHLVERLVEMGAQVRCLVRKSTQIREAFLSKTEVFRGDLESGEGLEAAFHRVDTVFHLAGAVRAASPSAFDSANVRGTENAARMAAISGTRRFVHVSSLSAMGPSTGGNPLSAFSALAPVSHYGRSKNRGEQVIRAVGIASQTVIVRPAAVYGPRDRDLFQFFRAVSRGRLFRIGRKDRCMQLIFVRDLVGFLLAAASADVPGGSTFLVGNPEPVCWNQLGREAASIMQKSVRPLVLPVSLASLLAFIAEGWSRVNGNPCVLDRGQIKETASDWRFDVTPAIQQLGYAPQTDLQNGLRETLEWYQKNDWLTF